MTQHIKDKDSKTIISIGLFAITMGILEAVVAYYLRLLYFPEGFAFPMKQIPQEVLSAEWAREAATIVMLAAVGIIAGRNRIMRFAYFLLVFGIWDIVYYVGLKLLVNWPDSLLTWDLLFLIPIPWISPVIAPVICSVTMIVLFIIYRKVGYNTSPPLLKKSEIILLFAGAFFILASFLEDYTLLLLKNPISHSYDGYQLPEELLNFIPGKFNWLLFIAGETMIIISLTVTVMGYRRKIKGEQSVSS